MSREEAFSSISFKLLAHDVIFGGPDGKTRSKQIAEATGISYNRLSNCCNSNQVHNFTQDEIASVSNAAADYRMLEDLCRKCGGTFQRIEEAEKVDFGEAEDGVFELVSHIGRLGKELRQARKDNRISPNECSGMDRILMMIREGAIELSGRINKMVKR